MRARAAIARQSKMCTRRIGRTRCRGGGFVSTDITTIEIDSIRGRAAVSYKIQVGAVRILTAEVTGSRIHSRCHGRWMISDWSSSRMGSGGGIRGFLRWSICCGVCYRVIRDANDI